ncbi:DUF397 domain-containing protein [Streptomyces sp. NPDC029674]|uniref:DUF397 domain-containing protein n=1 Tax=Streptomyces sp. NPDC029674 TaxID=3365297 RepID=UPI00384EDA70
MRWLTTCHPAGGGGDAPSAVAAPPPTPSITSRSRSDQQGDCLEIARTSTEGHVIRNSKNPGGRP